MGRIRQIQALTWVEWRFLVRAVLWLPVTAFLLRLVGNKRTLAIYGRDDDITNYPSITDCDNATARTAVRMINIAANHGIYNANCLQKSLVLFKFLHRCHIPCMLVLGTGLEGGEFRAHAWVECQGVVLNDTADIRSRYAAFVSPKDRRA